MQSRLQTALHVLQLAAALGVVGAIWSPAHASGPRELFVEAAMTANLDDGDAGMLESVPACFISDKGARNAFCVALTVAADKSETLSGVIVTPKGVAKTARLQVLTAAAAAKHEFATEDDKGRAAMNRALGRVSWEDEVTWVHDYVLRGGKLGADAKREVALPDGRAATLDAAGLSVSDGTRLEVAPLPGRPVTSVSIYALPGTKRLLAAVYDAKAEAEDAIGDSRFVFSTRGGASPTAAPPVDASCPDGVWCPPSYGALKPLLDRFCSDDFGEDAVAETAALAERGALSGEDLSVLFNAYGALYGYTFKRKTEYNRFYYGGNAPSAEARRPWLPPPCRSAFGKYTTRTAPKSLRKARDAVKRLWRKHK